MLHALSEILINFVRDYGYFAIFILMTLESALIPIPSEITMPFAGFMVGTGSLQLFPSILVGAIGNLVGSLLAYYLGYLKGEDWVRYFIKKWGKFILIHEKDFDTSKRWFHTKGQWVTFGSRLLPIVRTFISLPAGIAKMDIKLFSLLTFIGSFVWSGALAYVGVKLGQNWSSIEPVFRKFQFVVIAGFAVLVGLYIYKHIKHLKD